MIRPISQVIIWLQDAICDNQCLFPVGIPLNIRNFPQNLAAKFDGLKFWNLSWNFPNSGAVKKYKILYLQLTRNSHFCIIYFLLILILCLLTPRTWAKSKINSMVGYKFRVAFVSKIDTNIPIATTSVSVHCCELNLRM